MESLYLLIPLGIVFVIVAIRILFWAINSGQYDNLDTEAHRILFDEDSVPESDPADNTHAENQGADPQPASTPVKGPTSEAPKRD